MDEAKEKDVPPPYSEVAGAGLEYPPINTAVTSVPIPTTTSAYGPGTVPQGPYVYQGPAYQSQYAGSPNSGITVVHTSYPHQAIVRCPDGPPPPDYLMLALVVTIFCCLPVGLVGIMKASEAANRWRTGDAEGAHQAAMESRTWSLCGLVFGLILEVVLVVLIVVLYV